LLPNDERLDRIAISSESKIVKTDMMQKIPIVIPSRERTVRTLFTMISWKAKR
jgi:hypothetical protein